MYQSVPDILLEQLPFAIAIVDRDNTVTFANRALLDQFSGPADATTPFTFPPESVDASTARNLLEVVESARRGQAAQTVFRYRSSEAAECVATLFASALSGRDETLLTILDQTDLGFAEQNLAQSENLYRSFLEQSPMGVLHLDAVGNVTFENQQFRKILGDEPAQSWVEQSIHSVRGLDPSLTPDLVSLLVHGQSFANRPVALLRADDTIAEMIAFGSPIRQPGGQIVGGVVMFLDRTLQLSQERELAVRDRFREAETRLRGAAMIGTEEDEFLDNAARILALSIGAEELVVLNYLPHDQSCRVGARWRAAAKGATGSLSDESDTVPHLDETALRHLLSANETDEVVWMPFSGTSDVGGFIAFRFDSGGLGLPVPRQQLLLLLDTLVRTFETLWESVQLGSRYRLAVSTINDGLFTYQLGLGGGRRYTFVTEQFESLLGVAINRILATDLPTTWFESGLDDIGHERMREHYAKLNDELTASVTYCYTRPDGETVWLREESSPHRNHSGVLVVSGILSDVTAQMDAEEVLVRSKERAEADARRKTSFLSTMSHEMRTPLGTVNGFASMLSRELSELEKAGTVPGELAGFADAIEIRARELLDFVDDLLDLSNVESGLLTLQQGVIDVDATVDKAIESVRSNLDTSLIRVDVQVQDGLRAIGDAQRLDRVLRKILDNAVKFTDNGGSIKVSATGDGVKACVEIADTGVGISSEQIELVASPFVQADDRLNRSYEGMGMGLTVAKRLIEAMKGSLAIHSRPGLGTSVSIILPQSQ